jgi:hypothetical protein
MKAWIENRRVKDIAAGDPWVLYHPDIAQLYDTEVPEGTLVGAELVEGVWRNPQLEKPPALPPAETSYPKLSPVEFKLLFTSQERIAIKAAQVTDPVVDDFMEIVDDPRLTFVDLGLTSTQNALLYLMSVNLLTDARRLEILQGRVQ